MTQIGIAIVEDADADAFLVGVRDEKVSLPGYYEFPGGKKESGESSSQAAIRECQEETGLDVVAIRLLHQKDFEYEHDRVQLDFWLCKLQSNLQSKPLILPWQWVRRDQLSTLNFPPANTELIQQLTKEKLEISSFSCEPSKGKISE